ncbi:MAG: chromosome partitioning protein ParB [Solirubrobacterales bacterium]|nr:chromosome partitioning protein ParB [Solirubrobacterales bacterium]
MPSSTGLASADAGDDFLRARRRQALSRLGRRLQGSPDVGAILPFEEVVAALGRLGERDAGRRLIDLDAIAGTVGRRQADFDRAFRPTSPVVRTRWERIALAMREGRDLPPISVYRVGDVYFVRDGHHRVSVARALGRDRIEAQVVEVLTRVGAERRLTIADLPRKSSERLFRERVPLRADHAARVRLTDALAYGELAEGVEAWAFRMQLERPEPLDRPAAALLWFTTEFDPVCTMIREAGLLGDGTEADAFLAVGGERYRLALTHEWSPELLARVRAAR